MAVAISRIDDVSVLLLARSTVNAVAHDLAEALTQALKRLALSAAEGWAFRPAPLIRCGVEEGREFGSLNR